MSGLKRLIVFAIGIPSERSRQTFCPEMSPPNASRTGAIVSSAGEVRNDETLELLARSAVSFAEAGADIVAPSAMMDGQVEAIRTALDAAGFEQVAILAYAAKFASAFYGPFREAAESTPRFGDRKAYQMDPSNGREALREVALDVAEGADMLMVKPAGPYLDIIRQVRDRYDLPLAAYQVSGEYAMLKAAAQNRDLLATRCRALRWLDRVDLQGTAALRAGRHPEREQAKTEAKTEAKTGGALHGQTIASAAHAGQDTPARTSDISPGEPRKPCL